MTDRRPFPQNIPSATDLEVTRVSTLVYPEVVHYLWIITPTTGAIL
jgi:hypothetical protein